MFNSKFMMKFFSLCLSVLVVCGVISTATPVFAADYSDHLDAKALNERILEETVDSSEEKAAIVSEVTEKREEYSKTYKRADGTYVALLSQTPLHTLKNGEWVDIDNTLKVANGKFVNADGAFDIEFPDVISGGKKITVTNGGEKIAFSLKGIGTSAAVVSNEDDNEDSIIERDLQKTTSEIIYEGVRAHTDLQYVVSGSAVKENIIVNSKAGLKESYSFDIEKGNLSAVLGEDKHLEFKNPKGDTVFEIPAPVMTDSAGAVSSDIDVNISNAEGAVLTLSYTPSREWLFSDERAYPVTIDPVITIPSNEEKFIEDTLLYDESSDPETKDKNYINSPFGVIANNFSAEDETLNGELLVRLNMTLFKNMMSPSISITDVNFAMAGAVYGGNILAKPVCGTWNASEITYSDVHPTDGGAPAVTYGSTFDYFTGYPNNDDGEASLIYFNITDLFNKWANGELSNDGFVIVAENSSTYAFAIIGGLISTSRNDTHFNSFCTIDYVDTAGNNDSFEYLTQEIGRAGTASVNTFSRAFSLSRNDLTARGLKMPAEISFNYNPALFSLVKGCLAIESDDDISASSVFPFGNNWLPSIFRVITTIDGCEYQYFGGDGSLVTFKLKEETKTETVDGVETEITEYSFDTSNDGYSLEIIDRDDGVSCDNMKLTLPSGETEYFNEDGIASKIREAEPNSDGTYDEINLAVEDDDADWFTDGAGRRYRFVYDEETGLVTELRCLNSDGTPLKAGSTDVDMKITYTYDAAKNLTRVTYPDGKYVTYEYDSNGNLTKAKNIDGYNIQYTYDSQGKVTSFSEFAGTTSGNKVDLLQLDEFSVKVTDAYSGTKTYQFGKDGKLHYVFDDKGNYEKTAHAVSGDENVYSVGTQKILSENILKNGSFEINSSLNSDKAKYWSGKYGTTEKPSEQTNTNDEVVGYDSSNFGEKVYFLSEDEAATDFVHQSVEVTENCSYTFSAFVRSKTPGELSLKIVGVDASGNEGNEEIVKINSTEGWERYSVTFTPASNFVPEEITVSIGFNESCGEYYVDCAQLEKGFGTAEYNLVENGSFNNSGISWSEADIVNETLQGKSIKAVKLDSGLPYYTQNGEDYLLNDGVSSVTQNIKINGKKGDIYSLGGWFKGLFDDNAVPESVLQSFDDAVQPPTAESTAQLKATYTYTETVKDEEGNETENTVTENFAVSFEPNNNSWQYAVDSFALKGDTDSINVTVISKNIPEKSYASGIELTLDNSAISFVDGVEFSDELTETVDSAENADSEAECPCEACEEFECTCRCESEEACTCVQCKRRTDFEVVSDDGKTVFNKSFDGVNYLNSSVTYSNDFNSIASTTDTNGVTSSFSYNADGSLTSATEGANGAYEYQTNPMGYITLLSCNISGLSDDTVKAAISCVYDGDMLKSVSEGNVEYTYAYDVWSQLKKVSVDGKTLVSYNYGNGVYRSRILSIVFGASESEGFTVKYTYNSNGDVTRVEKYRMVEGEKDSIVYTYKYDNLGNIDYIKDDATGYFYDYTDNGVIVKNGENGAVIYKTETVESEEDEGAPSYIIRVTANGVSYDCSVYESTYDSTNGKTTEREAVSTVLQNNSQQKTLGTETVSDWFGRTSAVNVMTKDPTISAEGFAAISSLYSYKTSDGVTTGLITAMDNTVTGDETNSVNYRYTYDANGRILSSTTISDIASFNSTCTYIYDEAGQLVKETVGSTSYEYAYDSKGNITSRKAFYGDTTLSNDTFTYGATEWENKLTAYNGKAVTYDSIGNPTTYLGATLSWRGRELASYNKGSKNISYSYDVDGMRYKKVIKNGNTVTATYDYVYFDEKLVLLTYTENGVSTSARFVYDSAGNVRGFILNDSAVYMYLKNAQGDVSAVVDENGTIVIRYTYNAWGETEFAVPSGVDPADTALISKVSPFCYRGYCYDFDIGLYYLQSRYYDPKLCRFINADSTDYLGTTGTPLSYNLFAYCENDPVNFVDIIGTVKKAIADVLITIALYSMAMSLTNYADYILALDNVRASYSISNNYNIYSLSVFSSKYKWYGYERYELKYFGATVENWYALKDAVDNLSEKYGFAYKVSNIAITTYFTVAKKIAGVLGVFVEVVALLISDASSVLEKNLRFKRADEWYHFIWHVKHTYQYAFIKQQIEYYECYCYAAALI